ncbi:hypothetical protein DFJ74DRAFT_76083 [Hyaloraphidium curvatum]|nr:hypothetical protein DFJ74DRAFT_76083 [Hyaloraphidium curvatum]
MNFSTFNNLQFMELGGVPAFGVSFWGFIETFLHSPVELAIRKVVQASGAPPPLPYGLQSGSAWGINATTMRVVYAGDGNIDANFTVTGQTPYGPRMAEDFVGFSQGVPAFNGTVDFVPVRQGIDAAEAARLPASGQVGVVNRTQLATSYILQGTAGGFGNFTGVSWLAVSPANGVIDNGTIIWTQSIRPSSGSGVETYTQTGTPASQSGFPGSAPSSPAPQSAPEGLNTCSAGVRQSQHIRTTPSLRPRRMGPSTTAPTPSGCLGRASRGGSQPGPSGTRCGCYRISPGGRPGCFT